MLTFAGDVVRANKQSVRIEASLRPLLSWLRTELSARGISGLSAPGDPGDPDCALLVSLFAAPVQAAGEAGDPRRPFARLRFQLGAVAGLGVAAEIPLEERLVDGYSGAAMFAGRYLEQLRSGGEVPGARPRSDGQREGNLR